MKKKLLGATVLFFICTVFLMNGKIMHENTILLENIEALAADTESSNYNLCYSQSKVAKGYTYYDCGSCKKVYDEKGKGTETKCFY